MRGYILNGREPVSVDFETWAKWYGTADRHVADTQLGDVRISTVFLGLDHSFGGRHPLLFETMVFGGYLDGEQDRYTTWAEADAGHTRMVQRVALVEQ